MMSLLATVLVASLLGSVHCAGMCGPFVALTVAGRWVEPPRVSLLHVAYHGGRLITYVVLGAAAGLIGSLVDIAGSAAGLQRGAALLAGSLMVAFGIATLLLEMGVRVASLPAPAFLQVGLQRAHRAVAAQSPVSRALLIGLLSTLLPCGWLYAFALTAAGSGAAWSGALLMAVFWVGTLPVLLLVGFGAQRLAGALGRRVTTATAVALIALGAVTAWQRTSMVDRVAAYTNATTAPTDAKSAAEHVSQLNDELPPCCQTKP